MKKIYAVAVTFAKEMQALEEKQEKYLLDNPEKAAYASDSDDERNNRPYQVIKGIALYDIKGKLLSSGNWFTKWMGIASYDVIANTFAQMSQDPDVDQVLLSMDTPGGHVSGLADISDAWRRLNSTKQVTVHSPGMLASAGMWIASNSTKIFASETAEVGSIGVIIQHVSYEESLKKDGVKVTDIKSSPLKHIGGAHKDLTPEETEHLQGKVNANNALFQKQMYAQRPGILPDAMTGEVFSASESLRLGLIDGIKTFTEVFEELSASADSNNNNSYTEDHSMKRKVTQAMAKAAVTAGADPNSFEIITQEAYDALTPEELAIGATTEGDEQTPEELAAAKLAEEEAAAAAGADEGGTSALEAQVATLTEELSIANASVETLTTEKGALEAKLEASNNEPLRKIAEDRLTSMRIALALTPVDATAFTVDSLVAEFNAAETQFKKSFRSGGHVAATTDKPVAGDAVVEDSTYSAANAATGIE